MEYNIYKRIRLLFLADEKEHQDAFEKIVNAEKEKYDCVIAESFEKAREIIQNDTIDVVICSCFPGNKSAIDLLPILSEIPLIVVGEFEHIDYLIKAVKTGAYDYVIKDSGLSYLKGLLLTVSKVISEKKVREIAVNSCLDEVQYRNIVQNIPDIIYRIDPDGYFTFVNQAIRVMGYNPEELIGKHFKVIIHPDDFTHICREEYLSTNAKKTNKEESPRFFNERRRGSRRTAGLEVRLICKSWKQDSGDSDIIIGSVISFGEISAQGEYRGKENMFIGTVGIIHDITHRKKAEALLRKMYEAVDQSPISTIITNSEGYIEYVNPLFLRKSGYSPPELQGKHIGILNPAQNSKGDSPDYTRILALKKKWSGEMISTKKSGERYWESVIISPIIDPDARVTNYLIIKMDITKQKLAQVTLQKAYNELDIKVAERTKELSDANLTLRKEIEERNQMEEEKANLELRLEQAKKLETLGTLAGGIAHDFNNLLTPILGFTEMVQDDLPRESSSYDKLSTVIETVNCAKDLIKQILTFSRRIEQNPEPVKVQYIIKEVLKLLRTTTPETILFREDIDPSCGPILIDPAQIYQVIHNLCNNAILAMEKNTGVVTVKLSKVECDEEFARKYQNLKQGTYIELEIADTGHGMDQNTMDHIFEPFFTTRAVGQGTGLGLSVVHGIVKSNHGEIIVQSKPGKGTQFHIYFPYKELPAQEKSSTREIHRGNERILFIDDEETIAAMIQELLERLGYEVTVSTNSNDALTLFHEKYNDFDLVITDQIMPGIIGEQLAKEFINIRSDIPIILLTGFIGEISKQRLKKFGIRECILKPIDSYTLSKTIRGVLENKHLDN
ncbi:MAG: PAS domain S-box protein [Spirochaetales bacterium]|nr:PAS domain S-box protein [Spirochaetales bacterium]